jgi:toxin-antitoxin system PIN domain toxin
VKRTVSLPCLLDVNALIALFDSAHLHHDAAHAWFATARPRGWRTCPITENGVLRILSHPNYPNGPVLVSDIARRIEEFKTSGHHEFWPDDFSLSAWIDRSEHRLASGTVTDAYLLKLAATRGGTLATFDLRIQLFLIGGGNEEALEYIPV